jgi:hypothetical protein
MRIAPLRTRSNQQATTRNGRGMCGPSREARPIANEPGVTTRDGWLTITPPVTRVRPHGRSDSVTGSATSIGISRVTRKFDAEHRADGCNTWLTFVLSPALPKPAEQPLVSTGIRQATLQIRGSNQRGCLGLARDLGSGARLQCKVVQPATSLVGQGQPRHSSGHYENRWSEVRPKANLRDGPRIDGSPVPTPDLSMRSKPAAYSITSSARASSVAGTPIPRARAVFRLIASSNLVGACTGRSDGLVPLRIRST